MLHLGCIIMLQVCRSAHTHTCVCHRAQHIEGHGVSIVHSASATSFSVATVSRAQGRKGKERDLCCVDKVI